ncbi:hypothetical protein F5883DRAFT_526344 [Diaporthe sp. PMI_573]|nr:hypothetical protein F5883DRAFT_526344 [Diaporthaceae sp. PMI_573]
MDSMDAIYVDPAITKNNMDQATLLLLAEKDQKIAWLEEQVARLEEKLAFAQLRRSSSSTDVSSPLSTPPALTPDSPRSTSSASTYTEDEITESQNADYDPTSIIGQEPAHSFTNEGSDYQYEYATSESSPQQNGEPLASSDGWCTESSSPTSCDSESPTSGGWDGASAGSSSWQTDVPSWEEQVSDNGGQNGEGFTCGEPPKWRSSNLPPESKSWLHPLSFGKNAHAMSDERFNNIIDQHSLVHETRLHHDDWLDSNLRDIRVDDEHAFRLAARGKEICQKIVWEHADKHQPEVRDRYWPGGWHQVKLEFNVLNDTLPYTFYGCRENNVELARDALFNVVRLRHLVCHWDHGQFGPYRNVSQVVETHLKNLQKLAINMVNKELANEARGLRDEFRQAVEDTVTELEELEPLFDDYEFKYNHQVMFQAIEHATIDGRLETVRLPDVVFRAADAWARRRSSLGGGEDASTNLA